MAPTSSPSTVLPTFRVRGEAFKAFPNVEARRAALVPFAVNGPAFIRRVRDSLLRAQDAWGWEGVGANLVEAEIAAGLRPVEDWPKRYDAEVYATSPASVTAAT